MRLKDKVAVITGGTRGLGRALGLAFAAEGARVVFSGRSARSLAPALAEFEKAGFQAHGWVADAGDLEQTAALAAQAFEVFGGLDIWVNNAGTQGVYGPTLDIDPSVIEQVVRTNVMGVYYGSRVAMRRFVEQGHGKLINIIGAGGRSSTPYQNALASSKAWVRSFSHALAAETKDSGAGVYAYSPGIVLTDMLGDLRVVEGSEKRLERFPTIMRMWARPPEQVVEKAVWLASSATDGKTGLEVFNLTPFEMLAGAAREGLRMLLRKEPPGVDLKITTVPPSR